MATTELVAKTAQKREQEEVEEMPQTKDSSEVVAATDALIKSIDDILAETMEQFEAINGEMDKEKPYTLADAMREGSLVTDQAIGAWTTAQGEACALSAAYLAIKARGLA